MVKLLIYPDITDFSGWSILQISLQYLQNPQSQDTWFLLLISEIVAHLQSVWRYYKLAIDQLPMFPFQAIPLITC